METDRCWWPGTQFPPADQQWELRCSAGFSWKKERGRLLLSERLHSRLHSRSLQLPGLLRSVHGSRGRSHWNKLRQPKLSSRLRTTTSLALHFAKRHGRFREKGLPSQEDTRSFRRPSKFRNRQERNHQTYLLIPDPGNCARRRGLKHLEVLDVAYLQLRSPQMNITRPDEDPKEFFRSILPDNPRITIRPMFGNISAFVNGNMFAGLFGNDLFVRLSEESRKELLERALHCSSR